MFELFKSIIPYITPIFVVSTMLNLGPGADVPVVQLSIDETQPPEFHYEIGKRLAPLRSEGILIMGSGNLVHNLHTYAWGRHAVEPFEWAVRFEEQAGGFLLEGDDARLSVMRRSVATPHWPLRRRSTIYLCFTLSAPVRKATP